MSGVWGGVEMVDAPSHGAGTFGTGSEAEMVSRFAARRAGTPTVVGGFTFTPFVSEGTFTVTAAERPQSASVSQRI